MEREWKGQRANGDKASVFSYQMVSTNSGFVLSQGQTDYCKDNGGMHKAEQINRHSQKIMRGN